MGNKKEETKMAEQQLFGFISAKRGDSLLTLIDNMGLQIEEWQEIRKEVLYLSINEIEEIDEYFKI